MRNNHSETLFFAPLGANFLGVFFTKNPGYPHSTRDIPVFEAKSGTSQFWDIPEGDTPPPRGIPLKGVYPSSKFQGCPSQNRDTPTKIGDTLRKCQLLPLFWTIREFPTHPSIYMFSGSACGAYFFFLTAIMSST